MTKPYQIFIGCPFAQEIRSVFDRLKRDIENKTPLSLVLADTVGIKSSDYLLEHITELIRDSAGCIFDASGSNPNVSLEVGIAHTLPVDFVLTLKTRKPRTSINQAEHASPEVRPIISDLQGKNRIEYKTYVVLKNQLETRFLSQLPYMKRWKDFASQNSAMAPHTIRVFSDLRSSGRSTRGRLSSFVEGTGFSTSDILNAMTAHKLVSVRAGRDGGIFYPQK